MMSIATIAIATKAVKALMWPTPGHARTLVREGRVPGWEAPAKRMLAMRAGLISRSATDGLFDRSGAYGNVSEAAWRFRLAKVRQ
jgi:hypothetical protein